MLNRSRNHSAPLYLVIINLSMIFYLKSNAAKKAYHVWTRRAAGDTGSVLELARLDAWIHTWLQVTGELIKDPDPPKGSKRNQMFNEMFDIHLPKVLEAILNVCRKELENVAPLELRKPFRHLEFMEACRQERAYEYDCSAHHSVEIPPGDA